MDLTRLKQINEQKALDDATMQRHRELLLDNTKTQEVIVKSFQAMVDFLENRTSKTVVVNQLREIGTPDVQNVVNALESLHATLKTHENTDLSEITTIMKGVLDEAKKIPKELPKPEKQQFVDYSERFKSLESAIRTVEQAVKAQELKVEAPIVNVPEAQVNVDVDLKPVEKSIASGSKDVVKAVKGIKIPELKTDPLEKLLKKTNALLEELPELMPSGGGGGGRATPYEDTDGIPTFVTLLNGGIPVMITPLALRKETSGSDLFIAESAPGTLESEAAWRIQKVDSNGNIYWRDGTADFAFTATDITTGTFV